MQIDPDTPLVLMGHPAKLPLKIDAYGGSAVENTTIRGAQYYVVRLKDVV